MDAELAVLDGDPERARALLEELQQRDPADARVRELLRQVQRAPVG
jgi:Flp pilus assembly protein TadD